jgi:hypothetical protein
VWKGRWGKIRKTVFEKKWQVVDMGRADQRRVGFIIVKTPKK